MARIAVDVRADAGARPELWRRLHSDGVWLAVLDTDACDRGLEIRLFTIRRDGAAFVLGGSNEARLAAIIGDRIGDVRLIHAPGHHLPRIWPSGHHLVLDDASRAAPRLLRSPRRALGVGPRNAAVVGLTALRRPAAGRR